MATIVALTLGSAHAQDASKPYKIGLLLDMSGPYADITGPSSVAAARMAVEDFGGKVLGRNIEVLAVDHQNKADIAGATAREWFDNQGVEAIMDVAASATALAALEVAKARDKIIMFNGPGALRLTNEACGPYSVHWTYDTYSLAHVTGLATVKQGFDTWFFITADYAFGHDLERDTATVVKESGGKVLGQVRHPINTQDFSSFLLQAQASKAKVVGLANAGGDLIASIKQGAEFGLTAGGQRMAGLLVFISDIHSLGLQTAQGMLLTEAFYWDMNDATRAWSKRYEDRMKKKPGSVQAGTYSSVTHYLKAVQQAGTSDSAAVMKIMKETPVNDFFATNGRIREDGRMVHDMYLFEVKKPSESKGAWDYYKTLATIPGDQAFLPLAQSKCPLVKK